jgi:hypothetical protein
VFVEFGARDHLAAVDREVLENAEFGRRQRNRRAVARHRSRPQIDRDVLHPNRRRGDASGPPDERAQPREQLGQVERLHQIVVGAEVQAFDAVRRRVPRCQHQHWRPDAGPPQAAANLEAVQVGQHHV